MIINFFDLSFILTHVKLIFCTDSTSTSRMTLSCTIYTSFGIPIIVFEEMINYILWSFTGLCDIIVKWVINLYYILWFPGIYRWVLSATLLLATCSHIASCYNYFLLVECLLSWQVIARFITIICVIPLCRFLSWVIVLQLHTVIISIVCVYDNLTIICVKIHMFL